jgi:hypothetical protein
MNNSYTTPTADLTTRYQQLIETPFPANDAEAEAFLAELWPGFSFGNPVSLQTIYDTAEADAAFAFDTWQGQQLCNQVPTNDVEAEAFLRKYYPNFTGPYTLEMLCKQQRYVDTAFAFNLMLDLAQHGPKPQPDVVTTEALRQMLILNQRVVARALECIEIFSGSFDGVKLEPLRRWANTPLN